MNAAVSLQKSAAAKTIGGKLFPLYPKKNEQYVAGFIGTFALVFCGTGAIIVDELKDGVVTPTGIDITFGLIVISII